MDDFVELSPVTYTKYTPFIMVKKYRASPKRGLAGRRCCLSIDVAHMYSRCCVSVQRPSIRTSQSIVLNLTPVLRNIKLLIM